jgi:hypothetical protein
MTFTDNDPYLWLAYIAGQEASNAWFTPRSRNGDLGGQCLCRGEDSADRCVVHLMVAADGAGWHTRFAVREDRSHQPGVLRGDTLADMRFRNGSPSLNVLGTNGRR